MDKCFRGFGFCLTSRGSAVRTRVLPPSKSRKSGTFLCPYTSFLFYFRRLNKDSVMFDETKKYKNSGHFFFKKGDNLLAVSKDVPELPGVYYIVKLARGKISLVYIGKSGTINQDGAFKEQLLKGRINNKQDGVKRQTCFEENIAAENIDALDIYWFVTMDKMHNDLPGYVEGILMQRYFEIHGTLPRSA